MKKLLFLAALFAFPAFLPAQSAPPACDGRITIVRISEIKPEGTVEGFMAAVAAHKAWYMANSVTKNEIFATRVIVRDEKTHEESYSNKEFMTFHILVPGQPIPKPDDAYNAFVKLYRDNSDIKSEYYICLPDITRK